MANATALPANLRDKLTAVARRLQLWRIVRGVSLVVLVLVFTAGAALLADAWLDLSATVRALFLVGWVGQSILTAFFGLVVPLRQRLDAEALAAVIEARFPHL